MKILIANRGEIAVRIIRTIKELGYESVAVYTKNDQESLHVKLADYSVCIGTEKEPHAYLDMVRIVTVAAELGVDAIHPGYGFLSEKSEFAEVCEDLQIEFIGPSSKVIELMGDKINAIEAMKKSGIPTIPGYNDEIENEEHLIEVANQVGYPIMLKAAGGGGGKGIRIVENQENLVDSFNRIKDEMNSTNPRIYAERYFGNAKHIEVQVIADKYGNAIHLGTRDCSIQRNNQKVLEEAPAMMNKTKLDEIAQLCVKAAKEIGYESAGTFEFLVENEEFYFLEMNTRVQVEHPISEMITGVDIIAEQLKIANQEKLTINQKDLQFEGHAIEARINAEDGLNNFLPSPGKITSMHLPGGLFVRNDFGLYSSSAVTTNYDSMIGKVIVWGKNRQEALIRLERALSELNIDGIKTTKEIELKIIQNQIFKSGEYQTNFLKNNYDELIKE